MISTPKGFTENSPMSPEPSAFSKNNGSRKSLGQFTEVLDVKQKTVVRSLGAA